MLNTGSYIQDNLASWLKMVYLGGGAGTVVTWMTKTFDCRVTLLWLPMHSIKENIEGELGREQMLLWCVKRLEPLASGTKMSTCRSFFTCEEGE